MEEVFKVYKTTGGNRYSKLKVYEVSNLGRVKMNGDIIQLRITKYGYLRFGDTYIHRAVAELFIPNPENKPQVDHINTNKFDNSVDNLRWVTAKENARNPITYSRPNGFLGKHHSSSTKKVLSEKMKGRLPWNTGKKASEETKKKLRDKWIQRKAKMQNS